MAHQPCWQALLRRAKAYDGAGEYAKALQDLHALDASGADPGEDVASMKVRARCRLHQAKPAAHERGGEPQERLRLLSEAIPATAAPVTVPALVPASTAEVEAADGDSEGDAPLARRAVPVWTKLVLSEDIRLMPLPSNVTVADLGRAAARKFADEPGAAQLAVALPPDGSDGEPRAVVDDEALQTVLLEAAEASRPARVLLLRPDKAEHVEVRTPASVSRRAGSSKATLLSPRRTSLRTGYSTLRSCSARRWASTRRRT